MDYSTKLLRELTEANGVSGYEGEIRRLMARELKDDADSIEYDRMGSLLATKKGSSDDPRIMIVGHMDEIGFMVREITDDGYIKFLPLGGWWGHVALGQRMRIITSNGPVLGVIGSKPPHLLEEEDRKKVQKPKDMFIDVGAQKGFDVKEKLGIKLGDPIVPESGFVQMGNPDLYMSKAFDNRVSCGVVVEAIKYFAKNDHPNTVLGAGSVQEEVGLRGANTVGWLGDPDVCLVADIGIGQDVPPDGFKKNERLGNGPSVLIMDAVMIPNIKLRDLVIDTAEKNNIPYNLTYMDRGGTDGGRIHIQRVGVPSVVIGPPVRYIHSHNGILSKSDYDNTVKLFCEVIKRLDKETVASLTKD